MSEYANAATTAIEFSTLKNILRSVALLVTKYELYREHVLYCQTGCSIYRLMPP